MPRDGSGNYTYPPGTPGIPDTTIESAKYNGYIADVQQDLNLPRPIVAGGTGATNPTQARADLVAEVAMQVVTNFDSQPWEAGSFKSSAGATGSPDGVGAATNGYAGTVQVYDSGWIVVQARNLSTGTSYVRRKTSGTWGGWFPDSGAGAFVLKTGDSMSGGLSAIDNIISKASSNSANPAFSLRSETDVNAGGVYWDRATNTVRLSHTGGNYVAVGATAINTGGNVVLSGQLTAGGAAFMNAGLSVTGTSTLNGTVQSSGTIQGTTNVISKAFNSSDPPALSLHDESGGNAGGMYWDRVGNEIRISHNLGTLFRIGSWGIASSSDTTYKPTGGPWLTGSDARIKTVIGSYQHGLAEVLTIEPVIYTYKGNMGLSAAEAMHGDLGGKECIGIVAQQVEGAMPEMVSEVSGFIDGQPVEDLRILDTGPLIYALVNAVKTLTARIEALEAAQTP